ncbi:MAG: DUF1990 domain-containing protein [Pyrinomonadaceae bacterium MAG19_C2-C3]|nr:DUF1990 domain-containing protein [Pyrinomonadaceae bacterium MAG19_C2-C3]
MLRLTKPSEKRIRHFLADQQSLPFSYCEVGATRNGREGAPRGYPINHYQVQLGTGEVAYRRAAEALQCWTMYALRWTRLFPAGAPISMGVTVGVRARCDDWLRRVRSRRQPRSELSMVCAVVRLLTRDESLWQLLNHGNRLNLEANL